MEKKQDPLCRMRDGWCRDCESSEYQKDCMEKETKHTPEYKKLLVKLQAYGEVNDASSIRTATQQN